MPRSSDRTWPIAAAAAAMSCPTTSPMTSTVAPSGCRKASYQSPPTCAACGGGLVADDDLDVVGLGRRGEHGALQPLGEAPLLAVQAGVVQREAGAAGDLLRGGQVDGAAAGAVGERDQADRAAAPAQRQDRQRLRRELEQRVAGEPGTRTSATRRAASLSTVTGRPVSSARDEDTPRSASSRRVAYR